MSQSIILACPSSCRMSVFAEILERTADDISASLVHGTGELQLVGPNHRFYLTLSEMREQDAVALDYDSNEDLDAQFRSEVLDLRFYLLCFNDFGVAKRVLHGLLAELGARGMDPWLDTDFGWVIRGADAVAKMRNDPAWDWRRPAPAA